MPSHVQLLLCQLQFGYGRKSGPPGPVSLVTIAKVAGAPGPSSLVAVTNILPSIRISFVNGTYVSLKVMFI